LRTAERCAGRTFYELRSAAHFGAPENPVVRTKTVLSQFVASVQLTGVPLHVAIGETEFGGDVGVGQTIGMGCEKFQDRELPFLRARHAGNCSTRSYSGVLFARCGLSQVCWLIFASETLVGGGADRTSWFIFARFAPKRLNGAFRRRGRLVWSCFGSGTFSTMPSAIGTQAALRLVLFVLAHSPHPAFNIF
jgi:hypothetical protein